MVKAWSSKGFVIQAVVVLLMMFMDKCLLAGHEGLGDEPGVDNVLDVREGCREHGIWRGLSAAEDGDSSARRKALLERMAERRARNYRTDDGLHFSMQGVAREAMQDGLNIQGYQIPQTSGGAWVTATVDSGGWYTSLALDAAGNAHISHGGYSLKYATNASGAWVTATVDSQVGSTSLALDAAGHAHISYLDWSNFDLKYATNARGNWKVVTVDSIGDVGLDTSLALDAAGHVHISYYGNYRLKYATNASGKWEKVTVDGNWESGWHTSIALDAAGHAHISYHYYTGGFLNYATNASGKWEIVTVDSNWETGRHTSIALDAAGHAHISYSDYTNKDLKYATNAGGAWVTATVDSIGTVGRYTSLALDAAGHAHISYLDETNHNNLKYATNVNTELLIISKFLINKGAPQAKERVVRLNNKVTGGSPTHYMASELSSFRGAVWKKYAKSPRFTLSAGSGNKTVYFKVKNESGESEVVSDSILIKASGAMPDGEEEELDD